MEEVTFEEKPPQSCEYSVTSADVRLSVAPQCHQCRLPATRRSSQFHASEPLTGRPAELAEQFAGLSGHTMVSLLLGVAERPKPREIA